MDWTNEHVHDSAHHVRDMGNLSPQACESHTLYKIAHYEPLDCMGSDNPRCTIDEYHSHPIFREQTCLDTCLAL